MRTTRAGLAQDGVSGRAQARLHHRFGAKPPLPTRTPEMFSSTTPARAPRSLQVGYGPLPEADLEAKATKVGRPARRPPRGGW